MPLGAAEHVAMVKLHDVELEDDHAKVSHVLFWNSVSIVEISQPLIIMRYFSTSCSCTDAIMFNQHIETNNQMDHLTIRRYPPM